jgi:methylaspartate ammonia-lyase
MKVIDVVFAHGQGAFFYDDQAAIRNGAKSDGFLYEGRPVTEGFWSIRIPAESLSIGLVLSDGSIAWGDMMSVQYSGAGGRDPVFRSRAAEAISKDRVVPRLIGYEFTSFKAACNYFMDGESLPFAVRYGLSQALLCAMALAQRVTMAEVIRKEFEIEASWSPIPLYAQCGDSRDVNVDKMILKRVDILPHGLINSPAKFGRNGEVFEEFVRTVVRRIKTLGAEDYHPTLHFDVYSSIGLEFGLIPARIAEFIARISQQTGNLRLQIEAPADFGSLDAQIEGYAKITESLRKLGCSARVVVDERCNTLDDILLFAAARAADVIQIKMPDVGSVLDTIEGVLVCQKNGVGAYVGGSCVETDLSARVSVHVAVATQADMLLAKPGMGVDEALSIVGNEQARLLATLRRSSTENTSSSTV